MVMCDTCNHGYHIWCLDKQLFKVPEGKWLCPAHGGKPLPINPNMLVYGGHSGLVIQPPNHGSV